MQGLCLASNRNKHDDQPLSKCLLVIMLISVTVTAADGSRAAFTQAAHVIAAVQAVTVNVRTLIALRFNAT